MITKTMPLADVEEYIAEVIEEILPGEIILDVPDDQKAAIVCDDITITIPDLKLKLREGTYGYVEETGFEPDFSLTLIYDADEEDPAKWLYFESSSMLVSLHNYCNAANISRNDFSSYDAIVTIAEEEV